MFQRDCLDSCCFECLIRMCFVFLYLHLCSVIEHVSHGKAPRNMLIIIAVIISNWCTRGSPARCLAFWSQCLQCLAQCQYTMALLNSKFDLQFESQWGSTYGCLSRCPLNI